MSADALPQDLSLSGHWRASVATDELRREWNADTFDDGGFIDIDVPSHWRTHPDFADNDEPVLYRRRFNSLALEENQRAWLWLDGLFYQGDVWLNGAYLGDTEGYFMPHHFEITDAIRERHDHLIGIEVTCTPPGNRNAKRALTGTFQDGPFLDSQANPGGIWRGVRVHRTGPVAITTSRVLCTEATTQRALVTFHLTLDATETGPVTLFTRIGEREHRQSSTLAAGENQVTWTIPIEQPALWWPHSLGAQNLHDVSVEVHLGHGAGDETVAPSDSFHGTIGLRRVEMHDFVMSVNGERLFLKGANIGPISDTLADVDPDAFTSQIATAVDAGLDLLRVHSHISRPELYEAADRAGMLLWQDLPLHRGYHRGVRRMAARQARDAVDLLGHHPSIAIWCGHNEPDIGSTDPTGIQSTSLRRLIANHEVPNWNRSMLDRSIRRAFVSADPTRPAIAGSGVWPHPPALDGTDVHLSLGWRHGEIEDLPTLARALPRVVRFVGEFGSPSVPEAAEFCSPNHWPDLDWERLVQEHGYESETFERRLPPDAFATFDDWRSATQQYQADLIRNHVEVLRRLKYQPTGGFNVFYLFDARPAISASLIDHEGTPKAAFATFTAACAPVIATVSPWPHHLHPGEPLPLDVHVVSDLRTPLVDAQLDIRMWWNGGEMTWSFGGNLDADSCTWIGHIDPVVPETIGPLAVQLGLTAEGHDSTHTYTGRVHTH